ncbi:MAG: histidine--tRNA ligase [Candidatus Ratteibacteria bacterium]
MNEEVRAIRGVRDILPEESLKWRIVEDAARELFVRYGFGEIRLPLMEELSLFRRSVGNFTDIVQKEMYVFQDKKGRTLSLRPEATASVVRAFIEHRLFLTRKVTRLYYVGPMFRYDRPQKGRYRQFYQIGVELFGGKSPRYDAEIIMLAYEIFSAIGMPPVQVALNSVGCSLCKTSFAVELKSFLHSRRTNFCPDCLQRMNQNILRVLDCKVPSCRQELRDAPLFSAFLCDSCASHHAEVVKQLSKLNIPFYEDSSLVRGLDYYTKTVFEFLAQDDPNALCGGGRYDNLVANLGGPETSAIGFAIGMDRVCAALPDPSLEPSPVRIIFLGENACNAGCDLVVRLRKEGVNLVVDYDAESLKNSLKSASRESVGLVVIIGENELSSQSATVRNMTAGTQEQVAFTVLSHYLKEHLACIGRTHAEN